MHDPSDTAVMLPFAARLIAACCATLLMVLSAPCALASEPASTTEPDPRIGKQAWLWEEISTAISPAQPDRWSLVLEQVDAATRAGTAAPGARAAARAVRIFRRWRGMIVRFSRQRDINPAFVTAVIAVESGGNPRAISRRGAGGLMQLMPKTARRLGVRNSLAPAQNVRGGAKYLDWLLKRFAEDPVLALAGYNAGEGAVESHEGVPPYAETRDYVPAVAAAYLAARKICAEAPVGPRDACVLK